MNANEWVTEVVPIEVLKSEACFVIWLLFYRVDIFESFVACGRNVNEKQLSKDPKVHLTSSRQSLYSALLILLVHRKSLFTLRSENDNCDARRSTFPGVEPGRVCSLRATGAKLRTCTNPLHDNEVTSPKSCGELSCHGHFRVGMNWNSKWCYSFFNQGVKIRVMSFFSRLENCTNIALVGDGTIIESNQFISNRDRARSVECDCEFPDFMFLSVH